MHIYEKTVTLTDQQLKGRLACKRFCCYNYQKINLWAPSITQSNSRKFNSHKSKSSSSSSKMYSKKQNLQTCWTQSHKCS